MGKRSQAATSKAVQQGTAGAFVQGGSPLGPAGRGQLSMKIPAPMGEDKVIFGIAAQERERLLDL